MVFWAFLWLFALAFYTLKCKPYVFAVQRDRFICSQDKAWNSGRAETRACSWSSKKGTVCWTRIVSGNLNAEWKKHVKSEVSGNAVLRSTFYNSHQRNKYCLVLQSIQNFTELPHWRRQVERLGFYFITCTLFQILWLINIVIQDYSLFNKRKCIKFCWRVLPEHTCSVCNWAKLMQNTN